VLHYEYCALCVAGCILMQKNACMYACKHSLSKRQICVTICLLLHMTWTITLSCTLPYSLLASQTYSPLLVCGQDKQFSGMDQLYTVSGEDDIVQLSITCSWHSPTLTNIAWLNILKKNLGTWFCVFYRFLTILFFILYLLLSVLLICVWSVAVSTSKFELSHSTGSFFPLSDVDLQKKTLHLFLRVGDTEAWLLIIINVTCIYKKANM